MQRMPVLLCVVALPAIILMVGCTGGGSQGERAHPQQGHTAKELELRAEHGSGVSGSASFEDRSEGVVVKLDLRNLPKPDTLYLAHIHPGTCAEGEEEEHREHAEHHEEEVQGRVHEHGVHAKEGKGHEHVEDGHGHGEEIEYPLSQVKSNSEGHGSSTTTLRETSVDKLFSGEPKKHVNVHEAGSGNPPVLTCADLKRAG
jgi:hypothetical protein